jgi:hypothetical protein
MKIWTFDEDMYVNDTGITSLIEVIEKGNMMKLKKIITRVSQNLNPQKSDQLKV